MVGTPGAPGGVRRAPQCLVWFKCPKCQAVSVRDAYQGVVSCRGGNQGQLNPFHVLWVTVWVQPYPAHGPTFMEPVRLVTS